ncbi:unnamed protein product [Bathycoccus prasinos]
MQASVHFVGPIDITEGKFFPQEMLSKHTTVYVSNIAKFEPSKWRKMKRNLQRGNLPAQVDRINFVHSSKYRPGSSGLVEEVVQAEFRPCIKKFPAHFTAHQNAWQSVKSWIPRDTSRVIEVTSRVPWGFHKQLWGCRQHCSNNVHITEHNGSSKDWRGENNGFHSSHRLLANEIAAKVPNSTVVQRVNVLAMT